MTHQGPYCSFCLRKQEECETLVAGERAYICNKCVEFVVGVLSQIDTEKEARKQTVCKGGIFSYTAGMMGRVHQQKVEEKLNTMRRLM